MDIVSNGDSYPIVALVEYSETITWKRLGPYPLKMRTNILSTNTIVRFQLITTKPLRVAFDYYYIFAQFV